MSPGRMQPCGHWDVGPQRPWSDSYQTELNRVYLCFQYSVNSIPRLYDHRKLKREPCFQVETKKQVCQETLLRRKDQNICCYRRK